MTPTIKDITSAIKELQDAMLASFEAQQAETNAKQERIKAHYRLSLARETVRALTFNQ